MNYGTGSGTQLILSESRKSQNAASSTPSRSTSSALTVWRNMANDHVQVLRVKKLKGGGIINIAARHNLREIQAETGADSHIDPRRTVQNIILQGAGAAIEVAAEAIRLMEQADVLPLRKGAVVGLEIIFSLPPDSGISEREYFTACTDWSKSFFETPIISAVIHNDEYAPHCHVIMLPLFNGRMIGNSLVGNKARLLAMQSDFHAKVSQAYGLTRQAPAKRYSASVRADAALSIVKALRRSPKALNDPSICDALRDALAISLPENLMALLNLDMPKIRTPKPKTFAGIWTQNKPERKVKNTIVNCSDRNTIAFTPEIMPEKTQTLSCVVFPDLPPIIQAATRSVSDEPEGEYTRERDTEQAVGYWDDERGEYIHTSPPNTHTPAPVVEQARAQIAGLKNRRHV